MSTHDAPQVTADVPEMPAPRVRENQAHSIGGGFALLLGLVGLLVGAGLIAGATAVDSTGGKAVLIIGGILIALAAFLAMCGLNMVAPGEARVVQLFGRYRGTIRQDGLRWVNPFTSRTKISTRVRNHETAVLKVNDAYGNPIELAAVVVWRVEDTAQATFEVDDYVEFVSTQTEAAVRHIAIEYPYDAHDEDGLCCAATPRRSPRSSPSNCTRAWRRPACRSSSRASRTSRTRRRSPRRCSSGSRPVRWSPRGGRSWTARSAWSRPRSPGSASRTSWNWTTSARRRWCPT